MSIQTSGRLQGAAVADADGTATFRFRPQRVPWVVSQVSVEMPTAEAGTFCTLRVNGVLVTPLVPTGDAAAGEPPLILNPGDVAEVVWESAIPSDVGRVLVFYERVPYE